MSAHVQDDMMECDMALETITIAFNTLDTLDLLFAEADSHCTPSEELW